jgi:hypothetical protein
MSFCVCYLQTRASTSGQFMRLLSYPIFSSPSAGELRRSIDACTLAQRWFDVKITANSRRCAALAINRVMVTDSAED